MILENKNSYDNFIVKALAKDKFLVSNQICELLSNNFDVTNIYARKLLERSVKKGCIKSSAPLTFGKGQFVYFSQSSKLDKDIIKQIASVFRPPLFRLLECLDKNEGIISYYEALKITASPIKRLSSKIDLLDDLINVIKPFEFVYLKTDTNNVKYIILQSKQANEETLISNHFRNLKLDATFVKDILDWLIKSNLILAFL